MIFAISDTHFDGRQNKPMDVFSEVWENHMEKIKLNWTRLISENDTVLMAGDISWALKLEDAYDDLKFIDELPGNKIISRGNHDYWWHSLKKMNEMGFKSIRFLQNDAHSAENFEVAGTRGWTDSSSKEFKEGDEKFINRELIRLELSLQAAKKNRPIITMLHYPPFDNDKKPNIFHNMMKKYNVEICVYAHLHGKGHDKAVEGDIDGIKYFLSSSDYIYFTPIIVAE